MKAVGFRTVARTIQMMDGVKLFLDREMASRLLALLQSSPTPSTKQSAKNLTILRYELERLGVQPAANLPFKVVRK